MMDELLYALYVLCMLCTLLSFHVRIYIYGFRFRGRSWARLVEGGDNSGWEVRVKGGLSPRPDSGRINSSPITAVSPVIKLRQGVTHTITIPGERQVEVRVHYLHALTVHLPHAGTYRTRKFSSRCGVLHILLKHTAIYR